MTFPTVIAENGGNNTSDVTSVTVNLPDGSNVAGRMILLFFSSDGSGETFTYPAGWGTILAAGGTGFTNGAAYKITDGSEGYPSTGATITVGITSVEQSCHTTYLIEGFAAGTAPAVAAATTGTSTAPDPGALNPGSWDVEDTLWFAFASANGASATTPRFTGYPTNYTNTRSDISAGGNGVVQGVARRENATASEDPGAFTLGTSVAWRAATFGIRPAAVTSINGVLSQTQSGDSVSSSSTLAIKATATQTQADNTLSAAATVKIAGVLVQNQADNTLNSASTLLIKGVETATQADNTPTATGTLKISAVLSQSQADNTPTSASTLQIKGVVNQSQADNVLSAVSDLQIKGLITQSQADNTSTATGALQIRGIVAQNQADNTNLAVGSSLTITNGELGVTQDNNTLSAVGNLQLNAIVNQTQADNTTIAASTLLIKGVLDQTQAGDALSASGSGLVTTNGILNATQADNAVISSAVLGIKAVVNQTQADNALASTSTLQIKASVETTQADNTAVITATLSDSVLYYPTAFRVNVQARGEISTDLETPIAADAVDSVFVKRTATDLYPRKVIEVIRETIRS